MQSEFFRANRQKLTQTLGGGLVVLAAYRPMQSSKDVAAPFLQEANFWYLTGVDEPNWRVIIDGHSGRTVLVRPEKTAVQKIFDGEVSNEVLLKSAAADEIIEEKEFEAYLRDLARRHAVVHGAQDKTDYGAVPNPAQKELNAVLRRLFPAVQDCQKELNGLRAIKQPQEIAMMKKAIALTAKAFEQTRLAVAEARHEYELEALFDYEFRRANARHAYEPIVAAGANACTLHYINNSARLGKNQLVLLDVGARVNGYAADVTRTYARGVATKRQRQVHSAVQQAQTEIIALLAPNLSVERYVQQVDDIMKRALDSLGLLKRDDDYRRYFPHAISHGLGVDVHESLGGARTFSPGMVLTVEPGIYIPQENIGVRIEDDILITESGHENLSKKLSTDL